MNQQDTGMNYEATLECNPDQQMKAGEEDGNQNQLFNPPRSSNYHFGCSLPVTDL